MDARLLFLALPSAVVLGLLVLHSRKTLPPRRALLFWSAAAVFGLLRGLGVRLVSEDLLGGAMPYRLHGSSVSVAGVALQEIVGWCLILYLAWWVGHRLTRTGGVPVVTTWACVFLAAASWAVEATAVAAGWWSWTLPAGPATFHVPPVGLMDWALVGVDFLLPFLLLTAVPAVRSRWRFATLGLFPVHFASHLLLVPVSPALPLKPVHLWHWLVLGGLCYAAVARPGASEGFATTGGSRKAPAVSLPAAALVLIILSLVLAQVLLTRGAPPWPALLPLTILALVATLRRLPRRRRQRKRAVAALPAAAILLSLMVLAGGLALELRAAHAEARYGDQLASALQLRDRGRLEDAVTLLRQTAREHPGQHAARGFLGEIYYRTGRHMEARSHFAEAVAIKPDFALARRYLAVLALQAGHPADAASQARSGLTLHPDDLELRYLLHRSSRLAGHPGPGAESLVAAVLDAGPAAARAVVGLAFEVGDTEGSRRIAAAGLQRWPDDAPLKEAAERLGLFPKK